jgi:hypothetical protein
MEERKRYFNIGLFKSGGILKEGGAAPYSLPIFSFALYLALWFSQKESENYYDKVIFYRKSFRRDTSATSPTNVLCM